MSRMYCSRVSLRWFNWVTADMEEPPPSMFGADKELSGLGIKEGWS
jgi:hypothetical protein